MSRFYCRDCHCGFGEYDAVYKGNEFDIDGVELHCPYCMSDNVTDGDTCMVCGESIEEGSYALCDECKQDIADAWQEFKKKFNDTELEYLIEEIICNEE